MWKPALPPWILIITICNLVYNVWPRDIPGEQFKILNFTEELWHPHLSKAQIDDHNFVIVDNYREHKKRNRLVSRVQVSPDRQQLGSILDQGFYDDEIMADTELPGQNSTNKGPFNCACKFTLSDTPRKDSNNFQTLVNDNGSIEDGMLGEFVSLYDSNIDPDGDNTVPLSRVNTVAAPASNRLQTKNNETTINESDEMSQDQNESLNQPNPSTTFQGQPILQNPQNNFLPQSYQVPPLNENPQQYQMGMPQSQPQVVYVPVYTQDMSQQFNPMMGGGQAQFQENNNAQFMPNAQPQFMQQAYPQQQMQFTQSQMMYPQQQMQYPQQQQQFMPQNNQGMQQNSQGMGQSQQAGYIQQPFMMTQPTGFQVPGIVGMGMNQVPTLVYLNGQPSP
ncbi:unnamed protein product [Moneuplotes crassus]|uniref:Uncharacterized protein n=1 Tax=Euplotes crassus TaxID=5936 RepID=A0AAD1TYZ7_EUPCR|nr:unnamed protein product [Moneuplotes crassus]